ncbi:Progestin and adipoQ receptor family member 3 [Folsomia candida]|uniref:Progestin and adipoQ receptor family member 3 n=1 Tax=Folsomia candida TaxID=158441 RepID=A0A226DQB5_FOLCA|nr:Progestin and adipoQ receptor family member 3 [Folsomia candida]
MPPQNNNNNNEFEEFPSPPREKNIDRRKLIGTPHPAVVPFTSAPPYLKFNPYITNGYRKNVDRFHSCVKSAFSWNNETINIWTHFVGWAVFFGLTVGELFSGGGGAEWGIRLSVLVCFQACMLLSSCYHTFCCCSDKSYHRWLRADLLGVSLSLLGIYLSGIYFAYKCDQFWLKFYTFTVLAILLIALAAQLIPADSEGGFQWRLFLFGAWAAYGVIPTVQWVWMRGSGGNFEYLGKLVHFLVFNGSHDDLDQEVKRLYPGKFNYILSSHNIWHILIFTALYYWYQFVVMETDISCSI